MKYINKHNSLTELDDAILGINPSTSGNPESVTIEPLVLSPTLTIQGVFTFSVLSDYDYKQGDVTISFPTVPETGSNGGCYISVNNMSWESYEDQTVVVSNIKERNTDVAPYIVPWVSYLPNGNVEEIRFSYSSWAEKAKYFGEAFVGKQHIYVWKEVNGEYTSYFCSGKRNPMLMDRVLHYYPDSQDNPIYTFDGGWVSQIISLGDRPRLEYNLDVAVVTYDGTNYTIDPSDNFTNSPASRLIFEEGNYTHHTSFGPFFFIGSTVYTYIAPYRRDYYRLEKINGVWTFVFTPGMDF